MAGPSNVLVLEYFVGGGFPEDDLPGGIAAEALGMLWAILVDFQKWRTVKTVSFLDPRFENRIPGLNRETLPADKVVCSSPRVYKETIHSEMERCDAALIIAPETGGILSGLSAEVESAGLKLLGSRPAAVDRAGDKEVCSRILSRAALPTPEVRIAETDSLAEILSKAALPVVLKPLDGVGSEGVCLVKTQEDIHAAVAAVRRATAKKRVLIQNFVEGVHASVSLLAANGRSFPLSLNRQWLRPGLPFEYRGSTVPYYCEQAREAVDLACLAVNSIDGLRGYVGVDVVIQEKTVQLIEINPRLTTSYIGLRRTAGTNPAEAIYRACIEGILPEIFPLNDPVDVWKNDPGSWGLYIAS